MKSWIPLFLILSSLAFSGEILTIAVSLAPYANIVDAIGGEKVSVITMVPSNADPHSYEPKPATLKEFSKAKLYFSDSSGLDQAWLPRFMSVNPSVQSKFITSGIHWSEAHHHHDHQHLDPHLWTSPKQVLLIGKNILNILVSEAPGSKDYFESRFKLFTQKWTTLDAHMEMELKKLPPDKRIFLVFHPSYGYLARDYGLTQSAIEIEGKEPKPKDLQKLISTAKKKNISIVFVQPQFSKRAAESISTQLKGRVLSTNPLAYDIEANLRLFIQALVQEDQK